MKKFILMATMIANALVISAQSDCVIPMMVLVPEQAEEVPESAKATLETRMRQMVTQNGMEGGASYADFCLVAKTIESSKEVHSGTRPLITMGVELELFIGNNHTGDKFTSTSITINGAGRNEAKAYSTAFQRINSSNRQIQSFLKNAKTKIIDYYERQTPAIVARANSLALLHNYEEALSLLVSVPTCCSRYHEAEVAMLRIFQEYVDYDCAVKVNKARAIWNATQNEEGAALAGAYLAAIDPASSCREEALELAEQIRQRIGDEWEFYKEMKRGELNLERARIEAIRAIGIAFGENQKSQNIRENWFVR